jgi:quercetin dioxygenase-like cupin family protein
MNFSCSGYFAATDFDMCLVELILDSGETRILKPGDVLIHRGTMHGWRNRSTTETARMICFVLPSEPVAGIKY